MRALSLLPGAGREAGASHALAQATFFDERFFQVAQLLIEQIVR